ncbi:Aste57867_9349 [Aphanomyces stellatus]|uniref:Aste57867_9349 protein n=1 Tax=Aphanomyces stellatus TaxID=120398 RepID=A0A485KMM7_9STRA|nr:hypothetical protein As57867_009313 [Aphanomyces stellatus]VFT86230.1 Aste57867_9349 [Aphanomyces stellatus]
MPMAVKALGPRQPSMTTIALTLYFQRPVRLLGLIKHLFSALYYVAMCYLYFSITPADKRALQVYQPAAMCAIMGVFAVLHGFGLVRTCFVVRATRSRLWDRGWKALTRCVAPTTLLLVLHFVGVLCQSYQAYRGSEYLVDPIPLFAFAFVVALNCAVTPWFFLSRHKVVQTSVVPLLESVLGFFLTVVFQIYVFLAPSIFYSSSSTHQYDAKFNTRMALVARWVIASSPLDLVTKVAIQLASYSALRKLIDATHMSTRLYPTTSSPRHRHTSSLSSAAVARHFQFQFRQNRTRVLYAMGTSLYGIGLVSVSGVANWLRVDCPAVCAFAFAPWGTQTCQCCYIEINCVLQESTGLDIDSFLRPEQVGSRVFFIDVRRCALPQGIPLATLAPFQNLYGLFVTFSNMTQWRATNDNTVLPDSLTALRIRYSNLTAVPHLLASVPSNLIYLRLEGAPISTIPPTYVKAWATIPSISINEANLTDIPPGLLASTTLGWLELRGNHIRSLPPEWQPPVGFTADLSANALADGPWNAATQPSVVFDLSSNPISTVASTVDLNLVEGRTIVLDDTPFCAASSSLAKSACQAKCARLCPTKLIGDGNCDWSCYNAACQFDGGDCYSYGFE